MPGIVCKVVGCNNNYSKTKNKGITYHRFPKNSYIRDMWIQKCNKDGDFNPDNSHVCSVHFKEDNFERDLKSELLGTKSRRKLKPDAIPSVDLPYNTKLSDVTEIIFEVIELESNDINIKCQKFVGNSSGQDNYLRTSRDEINSLRMQVAQLKKKNLALELKYKNLENGYFEQIMLLKKRKSYFKKQ